jgi:hypothetical protein
MLRRLATVACTAAALLALGACNDDAFLTEQPFDFVGPQNFYRTQGDALAAVNGVYATFINSTGDNYYGRNFIMLVEYPTEMVTTSLSFNNERSLVDNYTFTPSQSYIYSSWQGAYAAINRANSVIGRVPAIDMDTTLRNRIVGEAKFLRGLHYFNLVRLFGAVPLHTNETTTLDSLKAPRAPAADVYAQIITDLQDAAKVLPASYTGSDIGRATKGAAKTLLAKVYLQRAGTGVSANAAADYQSALDLLNDVQATGGYSLVPDFGFLFDMAHEVNSEVIFDIQNTRQAGLGGRLSSYMAPRNSNYGASQNASFEAEQPFFDAYTTADSVRKRVTWQLTFTNKSNAVVAWDATQTASKPYGADTPYPNKFLDRQSTGGGLDEPNYIILRYADNLLMQAEAINELSGPTTLAYAAINAVRTRPALQGKPSIGNLVAGLSKAAFRDSVFAQRRLELALEGPNGYFDSQRNWPWAKALVERNMALGKTGNFKLSKYPKAQVALDDHFRLMPIPQKARDLNPNLTQNPGY